MGSVLDTFVVELKLDPSKFTKGQREAYEAAKLLEEQQEKSAKRIEHSAGKAGEALTGIRTHALELISVLTGGVGLVAFGANLTNVNAQLGRVERSTGIAAGTISKFQGLARIMGGDAESMARSFITISDAFAGWKVGSVSPLIADLRAISTAGGKIIDVNKGVEQSYIDLAENLKTIYDKGPDGQALAGFLGRKIGLDPALFDAMVTGNMQKVLDYVTKIGVATSADVDAFGELEKRMGQMGLKAESLGRKILGGEGGGAATIIRFADWLNLSPGEAGSQFLDWIAGGQARSGTAAGSAPTAQAQKLTGGPISRGGAFTSNADKEQFIRSEAAKRGINPNVAMQVAKNEGFFSFKSTIPGETSYGAYQLHVTPGGRGGHLGDQFRSKTGLDPSDPNNERAGILFALDDVTQNGWKAFHGAKNNGIGQWAGIDRSGGPSGGSTEVNIQSVTVVAPAGAEPETFANRFAAAVKRQAFSAQANQGQN